MRTLLFISLAGCGGETVRTAAAAYDQKEYDRAHDELRPLTEAGGASATVWYDLGAVQYRKGDLAGAIASWRAVRMLSPRDSAVAHNLAVARSHLDGVPDPADAPSAWLEVATPGELGLLGLLVLGAASIGAVGGARRDGVNPLWAAVGVGGLAVAGLAASGELAWQAHPIAVVTTGEAPVRDAPISEAPPSFTVRGGAEVRVERIEGDWVLAVDGEGRRGWYTQANLHVVRL